MAAISRLSETECCVNQSFCRLKRNAGSTSARAPNDIFSKFFSLYIYDAVMTLIWFQTQVKYIHNKPYLVKILLMISIIFVPKGHYILVFKGPIAHRRYTFGVIGRTRKMQLSSCPLCFINRFTWMKCISTYATSRGNIIFLGRQKGPLLVNFDY